MDDDRHDIGDGDLGTMGPVLRELDVREAAASRLMAEIAAEREDLRYETARREAELAQREAAAQAAIGEYKSSRDQIMRLMHSLCSTPPPTRKPAPKPTPVPRDEPPRKRGRPRKSRVNDPHDPGGPPAFGVQRDAPPPPDHDELRSEEDL